MTSATATSSLDTRRTTPRKGPGTAPAPAGSGESSDEPVACYHCGADCGPRPLVREGKAFCCPGCRTVYELLTENGLGQFYELNSAAGSRVNQSPQSEPFRYLDDPAVRQRLLDFSDGNSARVTFYVPAIHCVACVWLLENLFRLRPGIGRSQVNFSRKEVSISFAPRQVALSELVALLGAIGYAPELRLANLDPRPAAPARRRLWLQVGVAGFAFGNIMLFSITHYLGLNAVAEPGLARFFGWLSIALALPVLVFSAADYWRSAWTGLRQHLLTIDLPITVGLLALFGQSVYEIVSGVGEGYLDSLTGLIFFLLIGKVFQQKTYDRLSFDRDYKSFFPLSVTRRTDAREETVPLSKLNVGDRLVVRHRELIPADATLVEGRGVIDYSFVTGESEPVEKQPGDYLYAGGQQMGAAIEVATVKPVSHSYLTALWGHEAFTKARAETLNTLTNRFSRWFTLAVTLVALGAAGFWAIHEPARALRAFTAVLIVACPCALALSAPFALGTAQRVLARRSIFLKSQQLIETLAGITTVVFDKTGTLTAPDTRRVTFHGPPLNEPETSWVAALTRHSTHPYSAQIRRVLDCPAEEPEVEAFRETPGGGIEIKITSKNRTEKRPEEGADGRSGECRSAAGVREVLLGSAAWLTSRHVVVPPATPVPGALAHLALDGQYRGYFQLTSTLRPEAGRAIHQLAQHYDLALLSGDNDRERESFAALFGKAATLRFAQSPLDKLEFIRGLRRAGRQVLMVGDGLNDAGALKQSDAGAAVVENIGAFSPASDLILAAASVPRLPEVLQLARGTVRVVYFSFLISILYNLVGVGFAAGGLLSPLVCAVLMPLSSISVVAFACGATNWLGRKLG